jgi:hypothetical protein
MVRDGFIIVANSVTLITVSQPVRVDITPDDAAVVYGSAILRAKKRARNRNKLWLYVALATIFAPL